MNGCEPHEGYYNLLKFLQEKLQNNYFICTSNIDNYFERAGFDPAKIYGSWNNEILTMYG